MCRDRLHWAVDRRSSAVTTNGRRRRNKNKNSKHGGGRAFACGGGGVDTALWRHLPSPAELTPPPKSYRD